MFQQPSITLKKLEETSPDSYHFLNALLFELISQHNMWDEIRKEHGFNKTIVMGCVHALIDKGMLKLYHDEQEGSFFLSRFVPETNEYVRLGCHSAPERSPRGEV